MLAPSRAHQAHERICDPLLSRLCGEFPNALLQFRQATSSDVKKVYGNGRVPIYQLAHVSFAPAQLYRIYSCIGVRRISGAVEQCEGPEHLARSDEADKRQLAVGPGLQDAHPALDQDMKTG